MTIGLTGGIGSGKTTVSKIFETMGCAVYNSDDKAKKIYFNPKITPLIIDLLGQQAYLNPSEINKDYISKKVFANPKLLERLNEIIHPAVKEDFENYKKKFSSETIIIKESALLFEVGIHKNLDYSILVTAPNDIKINRIINRSNITYEEIEQRMKSQWTDDQKKQFADTIIINDGSLPLIPQVVSIINKLKKR